MPIIRCTSGCLTTSVCSNVMNERPDTPDKMLAASVSPDFTPLVSLLVKGPRNNHFRTKT